MPRVALIHDFLLDLRGAERVFAAICDAWPDADVFTAVYDEQGTEGRFAARHPQASFLQRLRPDVAARSGRCCRCTRTRSSRWTCAATTSSSRRSSAWAHGVLVDPGAVHVCYCHNPFRYAWSEREATLAARNLLTRPRAARAALALAPVGLDRGAARRRLRRQLGDHRSAHPALLRARGDDPAPAGGALALLARAGRRALPRAGGADGAQAHRRRRSAPSTRSGCRSWSWGTGRSTGGCGGSPGRPCG